MITFSRKEVTGEILKFDTQMHTQIKCSCSPDGTHELDAKEGSGSEAASSKNFRLSHSSKKQNRKQVALPGHKTRPISH